jgi:hypothetical protein
MVKIAQENKKKRIREYAFLEMKVKPAAVW